jgi:hypothetical protein
MEQNMKIDELINVIKNLTNVIEQQQLNKQKPEAIEHDFTYLIKRYIQEFIEAVIGLFIVTLILRKQFSTFDFIRIASIIAVATLIMEEYNTEYADNMKQGICFTIGANAFS